MLKIQREYINYIIKIEQELDKLNINSEVKQLLKLKEINESLQNTELLVPIIGTFSAGKSSLLNLFLGRDYLPVKITPETALATELRYSQEEYIEAIKPDNTVSKFNINDIEKITHIAHEFKFLKMYINNQKLKEIEPLILVDMPGFESPLDLHNQAIMEYIDRASHYIVLTSIESGTITRSMVRQLSDIQEYGRDFSFFLSKTNLRSKSEVEEIAENLQEQIEDYFDMYKDVILVDNLSGENLQKILYSIEPEQLFQNIFIDILKNSYNDVVENINITISSLGRDREQNKELINELEESFLKVINQRDILVKDAYERYSNTKVNKIIEVVGKELTNNLDELVSVAVNNGQDAMSQRISEIIRYTLVSHIKDSMSDIGNDIVDNFSKNLIDLNSSMSELTLSDDWLEQITLTTKNMLNNTRNMLNNIVKQRKSSDKEDGLYTAITTVLAVTTEALDPILEVVIIFLPNLLEMFMNDFKQQKMEENIKSTILTQIIPSLKRELRTKLPDIFNQQVQEMIKNISSQFESTIEEKKQTIESTQKEIDEKNTNIQDQINIYKEVNSTITTLANKTLYN